ncbi:zona pellucida sperm-binding protein 4-like isoform X2 [Hippoglossus hippoglossus]|uniref:zona pellucida sperm-binding protein 4-like isoform X2 n=1 Tax=Hippoglossus hippoglossus TaxID=8267 RepID=UPI00148E0331|nr:zona pellucida sperm-binding protein 4-like isoform X2 [Hippoglossus hippoglossus]
METYISTAVWVTFISLPLLLSKYEAHAASELYQATAYNTVSNNNNLLCLDGFMSVYISKVQFADLPHAIYVRDEHSGYYQAVAIAKHCHYFLGESDTFMILTIASHGCFVKRQKYTTSLTVVIMALEDRGGFGVFESIPLMCEWGIKEANKERYPPLPRQLFCSKDGFNITITQNATVPPLNMNAVWIPSGQSHICEPRKRSTDAVTFHFPFTDCGAQSMVEDGVITYWVNMEAKQRPQRGSIFRDTPFNLTVSCRFALVKMTQARIKVQGEQSEYPSTLRNTGILRTEMRFAKDPPAVTELGQPVYVEVSLLKHEDKDLVLLLDDCWATPTENLHGPQRWNLLVNGCPFTGDSHRTVVLQVVPSKELTCPSLHKWFVVRMFSFVKPTTSENQVYFHCNIEICKRPGCLQSCSNERRKLRRITPEPGQRILHSVVSGGPLLYQPLNIQNKKTAI